MKQWAVIRQIPPSRDYLEIGRYYTRAGAMRVQRRCEAKEAKRCRTGPYFGGRYVFSVWMLA